ncbi:MAG TPA: MFS transporter [Streptosporangiaceae bacterium]|nr:MFS transporter [Streptosporangiaceae bacterium]
MPSVLSDGWGRLVSALAKDSAAAGPRSRRRRWLGLFFIALGVAMIIVDATIVNVAVPQIIRDLGITSSDAQWVQEAYTLVFAALLLIWGRLADRYGRRLLFVTGAIVFGAASVLAALAQSGPELVGSRVAQGVGGAMMLPTSLSLLNAQFRGRERGIAFAVWGSTIGGTAALGPLVGGWLTTSLSWRWAFGINIPLGLAVVAGTLLFVPESKDDTGARGNDVAGALLSALGFGGIVFGLIEGRNYGWWRRTGDVRLAGIHWTWVISAIPVAFFAGVLALLIFAIVERRRNAAGRVVLLDLRLFAIPSFRNGNIAAAIVSLGEFGLLFSLPLWFQNIRGYSAFETGLALLPLAIGSFMASGFGAQLAQRRGPTFAVRLGILLELIGVVGVGIVIGPHTAWWATIPVLFGYGLGVGLATAQLTGVVLADVPVANSGQGSGTQSTTRQIGSALGIAILGTVLFGVLGAQLSDRLSGVPGLSAGQRAALVTAVKQSAGAAISRLAASPRTASIAALAKEAFSTATRWTAFCAAGFLALGLLASLSLGRGNVPAAAEPAAGAEADQVTPAG